MRHRSFLRLTTLTALFASGVLASFVLAPATGSAAAAAATLQLETTSRNACSPTSLSAPAGEVTIRFTNGTEDWQRFGVVGVGAGSPDRVREGESSTLTATLQAGTYTFWCGDDADKGMRGTLTVTAAGGSTSGSTTTAPPPSFAPPPSSALTVTANDNFFTPSSLTVPAGAVTLTVNNAGQDDHTFTIANTVNVVLAPGETKTVSFSVPAGAHRFLCAYHGSMTGTLTAEGSAGAPPPTATKPPATTPPASAPTAGAAGVTLGDFSFSPSAIAVTAGTTSLTVRNAGQLPHTFTVDGLVNVSLQPGEVKTVTFQAPAGTYRLYCAMPGHPDLGMTGTLVASAAGSAPPTSAPPPAAPPAPSGTPGHSHSVGVERTGMQAQSLPRGCRPRAAFVLGGTLTATDPGILRLRVARASKFRRTFVGKRAAVRVHPGTKMTIPHRRLVTGPRPGDRLTVWVGKCKSQPKLLVAMRVVTVARSVRATLPAGTVEVRADARGLPKFDKTTLEAPAGKVTLRLVNPSALPHNIALEGYGAGKTVSGGGVSVVTAELKPGVYTYYCAVPGHAQAGMRGTLVVK